MNDIMHSRRLLLFVLLALGAFAAMTQAHPASGIVVDHTGQVFFSDLETIWKLDTQQGKLSVVRAGVSGRHVHELMLDEAGNLYGAELSYDAPRWLSSVWQITPAGQFSYLLAPTDNPPRGMSLWRDRQSNMYLVEQNNHTKQETLLLRRTPDGKVTTLAGGRYGLADGQGDKAQFSSVGGMAWGADGSLYLTDGTAIRKVKMDGTVSTLARGLGSQSPVAQPVSMGLHASLTGLTVDARNNIYAADYGNRRVWKISPAGQVAEVPHAEAPYSPTGVAMAANGELYILEVGYTPPRTYTGPRVRRLSADGRSVVLAEVGKANRTRLESKNVPAQNGGQRDESARGDTAQVALQARNRQGVLFGILCIGLGLIVASALVWRTR